MRKIRLSLMAMVVLFGFGLQSAIAQTEVSGNIIYDKTWTVEGSPYIVVGTIKVYPEVTLTIEPGVIVKFQYNRALEIYGKLVAKGTLMDIIKFTSDESFPGSKNWDNIKFYEYKFSSFSPP